MKRIIIIILPCNYNHKFQIIAIITKHFLSSVCKQTNTK